MSVIQLVSSAAKNLEWEIYDLIIWDICFLKIEIRILFSAIKSLCKIPFIAITSEYCVEKRLNLMESLNVFYTLLTGGI